MKITALMLLLSASGGLFILLLFTFAVHALVGYPGFFTNVWPMLTLIGVATIAAIVLIVLGFNVWSAGLFKIALRRGVLALLVVLVGFGGFRWMTRDLSGRPFFNLSSPAEKQKFPQVHSLLFFNNENYLLMF
jgi:hypothetical protein